MSVMPLFSTDSLTKGQVYEVQGGGHLQTIDAQGRTRVHLVLFLPTLSAAPEYQVVRFCLCLIAN
jgi:hypothetical protein